MRIDLQKFAVLTLIFVFGACSPKPHGSSDAPVTSADKAGPPVATASGAQKASKSGKVFEGRERVKEGDRWGYADERGKVIIQPKYLYAGDFKNGFAKVMKEGGWGFIDKNGKVTSTDVKYDDPTRPETTNQEKQAQIEVAAKLWDDGFTRIPLWQAWTSIHIIIKNLPIDN